MGSQTVMTSQFQQLNLGNDWLLRNILSFLDPGDIKSATLVCRRWKEELECKEFWRWADIEVTDDNLDDVTKSNRILVVDTISLDKSLSDLSANIFLNFLINCDETLA